MDGNEDIDCGIRNGSVMWVNNNATCKGKSTIRAVELEGLGAVVSWADPELDFRGYLIPLIVFFMQKAS